MLLNEEGKRWTWNAGDGSISKLRVVAAGGDVVALMSGQQGRGEKGRSEWSAERTQAVG